MKAATFLWTALESSDGTRIFRRRHNIAGGDGLPADVKIFQLSGDTHSKILRRRGWQPAAPGAAGNSKWRRQERRVDTRTCNSLTVQFNEQHSTSLTSKLYFTSVYMGVGYYALDLILMWLSLKVSSQKLVAFLLPIFGNVDGSWRVTSKLMYEISRLSKLREDARRCSKDFQQVWYELEMFKVCRDDMPCEVKKFPIWGNFWGGLKNLRQFTMLWSWYWTGRPVPQLQLCY